MRLISLHINGFGKLCDFPLSFDEKLTCISEQNGYGKTTISAFIRAMFYSLPTARKGQTPETNQRIKYLPWNGANFGGRLTFSLGAKTYTIIRNFDRQSASGDEFQLIDAVSGMPSVDFSQKIGEELFGIDEEGFFRSTFSNGVPALSTLPASVRTRISSENENAVDIGQFGAAKKKLEDAIKQINGKSGSLGKNTARIYECKNELERCKLNIEEYHKQLSQIEEINNEIKLLQTQKAELDSKLSASAGAEAERVKLDNYNKLKEEIESLAKIVSDIEKRYSGKLASEIQIEEISGKIKEFEEKRVLLSSEIEHSQTDEFVEIFNRFKEELPTEEEMAKLSENSKIIELAQNKSDELETKIYNLKTELDCMHIENVAAIPSDAQLNEYRSLAGRTTGALTGNTSTVKPNVVPMILSGIMALVGVAIAFWNFTLGIVISAVFAVVLVAFLLLYSVKKTVSMGAAAPAVSNADRQKLQGFLAQFGFSADTDVNLAIDKLKAAANLKSEHELAQKDLAQQQEKLKIAKEFVDAALSKYQIGIDSIKGFELLKKQQERYVSYIAPTLDKIKSLKAQVNELFGELVKLFENVGVVDATEDNFSYLIDTLKKDVNEHKIALRQLKNKTDEAEENFEKDGISKINLDEQFVPLEEISIKIKELENSINELFEKRTNFESSAKTLSQSQAEYNAYSAEIENCIELEAADRKKLSVLETTLEFLNSAKTSMTQKYAVRVQEAFKKYSQKFISDKVQDIGISPDLEISVKNNAVARDTDFFSSGERGVMDVCLRLALVDIMFEKEKPFVILDDPFSLMDKENLSDALALVKEAADDKQIIYFTCHQSREIK